ncbi:hypothetical protein BH11ARM1_BH11ARM1_13360 [soil metagenome]
MRVFGTVGIWIIVTALPWLIIIGCQGASAPTKSVGSSAGIAGSYFGWQLVMGKSVAMDGTRGMSSKLELRDNGTYESHLTSNVMMQVKSDSKGTYTVIGKVVRLQGSKTTFMDDGYKKGTTTAAEDLSLKIESGSLVEKLADDFSIYFRKVGAGPPPIPKLPALAKSDPKALKIVREVERMYRSLSSYRDKGSAISDDGFSAKNVKFETYLMGRRNFGFKARSFDGKEEIDHVEIAWDGKKTRWTQPEYGVNESRPLANAMSIVQVEFGDSAELVPSLLLPKEMLRSPFESRFGQVTQLPDETVRGRLCLVVKLKTLTGDVTTLWIDKTLKLIRRESESVRKSTIDYEPVANLGVRKPGF